MEIYREIRASIEKFVAHRRDWDKHSLSSLLISGSAGAGKSELIKQVIDEIGKLTRAYDKQFSFEYFTIGTQIASKEQLDEKLKLIETRRGPDQVQVVVFDEFEKASADFDFANLLYTYRPLVDAIGVGKERARVELRFPPLLVAYTDELADTWLEGHHVLQYRAAPPYSGSEGYGKAFFSKGRGSEPRLSKLFGVADSLLSRDFRYEGRNI